MRSGRSTVAFQYPKAALGNILDCSVSSNAMKASVMRSMSASDNSQFFWPRFRRSGREPLGGVNELDVPLAMFGLAVGEHPDVGGDAGVVEHVERAGPRWLPASRSR